MATSIDELQIKIQGTAQGANKSINQLVKNLNTLQGALKNLDTSKLNQFANNSTKASNASKNLSSSFTTLNTKTKETSKGFGSLASAFGKFYASFFLVVRGVKGLWKSIENTGDYVEAFNYYTVSFGKVASKWDKDWKKYGSENAKNYSNAFVKSMDSTFSKLSGISFNPESGLLSSTGLKNLGLNLKEVTQYAAQLGSMLDSVGQSGETVLATTNAFVKLAGDISSLYNIDYESAGSALRSVLQGQSRAGYKFGWDTTMASLQATADKLNLSKAVSEMTQMEKQQLRILTILEQSRVAWGDQANTINTMANQIRLFKNNLSETSMILGQLFIPLMENVMPIINGVTMAFKEFLSGLAVFMGIEIKDTGQGFSDMKDDADSFADSLDEATESANKLSNRMRGFDKLNIISDKNSNALRDSSAIDLTNEIIKATQNYETVWNQAYENMMSKSQTIADNLRSFFEPISEPLGKLGEFGGQILIDLYELFFKPMADWYMSDGVDAFFEGFTGFVDSIDFELLTNFIETVLPFFSDILTSIADVMANVFKNIAPYIAPILQEFVELGLILYEKVLIPVWGFIKQYVLPFLEGALILALTTSLTSVKSFVSGITGLVGGLIKILHGAFTLDFGEIMEGFQDILKGAFEMTIGRIERMVNNIGEFFGFDNWNFSGIKEGLSNSFTNAINAVKKIWNTFANFLNKALKFEIAGFHKDLGLLGEINIPAFTINLGKIPTFQTGGFPEDGFFFANHNELVGKFSNGQTAVANNEQIVKGIASGVRDANSEQNALLREQNSLLRQLLAKDNGITSKDVFDAVRTESTNYTRRTGQPAFI